MNKKVICPRPFLELSMQHDGYVQPCCILNEYKIGHIKDHSLLEIWNSEKMQTLRSELITGDVKTCENHIKNKKCNEYYPDYFEKVEPEIVQSAPPKKLDVRLTGLCNIKCIMCNVWMDTERPYEETTFWDEGKTKIFPFLEQIDLLGGEPFIQKDTYKLIDEISLINDQVKWSVTTNGNWNFTKKIKEYLDKIKLNIITVSVDSFFPDTYLRIRREGNYKQMMKTIKDLVEYRNQRGDFLLRFDFVIQQLNMYEVETMIKYCDSYNVDFSCIYLEEPKPLSISELEKANIIKYLNYIKTLENKSLSVIENQLIELLKKEHSIDVGF